MSSLETLQEARSQIERKIMRWDGVISVGIGIEDPQSSSSSPFIIVTINSNCPDTQRRVEKIVQHYQRRGIQVEVRCSGIYKAQLHPADSSSV